MTLACFSMHEWPERLGPCNQSGVHIEKKPAIIPPPADRLYCFRLRENEEEMKPGKIRQFFCGRYLMKLLYINYYL